MDRQAGFVVARTLDGDLGILPGHVPTLGVLADGFTVRISGGEAGEASRPRCTAASCR